MTTTPFTIDIPQADLDDLHRRLDLTRWPDEMDGAGWDYGTNCEYLRELVAHWRDGFDWRAQEQRLNAFPQFMTTIDGIDLHYVHQRGTGPNPVPILLLHGWPSSFVQMLDIVPLLTDPGTHGGDPADSFDIVIASLPGYAFSTAPTDRKNTYVLMANLLHRLMTEQLGYHRYGIRASDLGRWAMTRIALAYPENVIGIHQSGSSGRKGDGEPTAEERTYLDLARQWEGERGYATIQETKPQTLAYGLNDSPAGLAAWILEKFHAWSDGDLDQVYRRDDLLTNVSIYWFTQTINPSIRTYRDDFDGWVDGIPDVPTGHLRERGGPPSPPREMVARAWRVDHWTQAPRGGHFLEWEQPEIVADDLRAFFRPLRPAS